MKHIAGTWSDSKMAELIPGVRNAVRAVIARDDALLVQHKAYEDNSIRFTLPGGAPNLGETLEEGLQRECLEELGVLVEIVELLHVADYYKPRDTIPPTRRQQVEFFFSCIVPSDYEAQNGPKPDKHQVDVVWLPLSEIDSRPLHPEGLKRVLVAESIRRHVYLGLID